MLKLADLNPYLQLLRFPILTREVQTKTPKPLQWAQAIIPDAALALPALTRAMTAAALQL